MDKEIFLSIGIPSYNRPKELLRLLNSIDLKNNEIEIVICEDKSPKRKEIGMVVSDYSEKNQVNLTYIENETNLGYDANIRKLIEVCKGKFILFMGDDDVFVSGGLEKYIQFLKKNKDMGYVLKTSQLVHANGEVEIFKYYSQTKFFEPGFETFVELFRKSVFISGFIINRPIAAKYSTSQFDGTLLYQLYVLAEVVLKERAAFCDIMLTQQYEEGIPYFGSSESEKELYTPGTITVENSINFIKSYFIITKYLDDTYGIEATKRVKEDMSKYSYPILSIQRLKKTSEFRRYAKELKTIGLANTIYFNIYYYALLIFGKKNCDFVIRNLKKIIGKTPKL